MTRLLVLLAAALLFSWMLQRGLRSLAGRAAQHPLAQILRLLLGGAAEQGGGEERSGQPTRRLERCQSCGTHVPPERLHTRGGVKLCDQCR